MVEQRIVFLVDGAVNHLGIGIKGVRVYRDAYP
jgi:hypothetical protein